MQDIPTKLDALVVSGNAIPSEKDEDGETLLFDLLLVCQMVTGTPSWSHSFLQLVNRVVARLIDSGVDVNASIPRNYRIRFRDYSGTLPGTVLQGPWSAAHMAFCALAMQATPCDSLAPEFSVYHNLISRIGLTLDIEKMIWMSFCPEELVALKSTCLDLLGSPYHLDVSCKFNVGTEIHTLSIASLLT
jgi:hypothetical protein